MLEKVKEFYSSGGLAAEVFKSGYYVALLSKGIVSIGNRHYSTLDKNIEDHIDLKVPDFSFVIKASEEWKAMKDSLFGRTGCGSSTTGYIGSTYYMPNSEEGIFIMKGESAEHIKLGKLEETVVKGSLEFVFERFRFGIKRGNQHTIFDRDQVDLFSETFDLYTRRGDIYSDKNSILTLDDIEF